MDENYLTKHSDYLSAWINESIASKGWERYDDLHIDEIDEQRQPALG